MPLGYMESVSRSDAVKIVAVFTLQILLRKFITKIYFKPLLHGRYCCRYWGNVGEQNRVVRALLELLLELQGGG